MAKGKKSLVDFISGKSRRLLLPYVFWTVLLWFGVQIGNRIASPFMREIGFPPMSVSDLLLNLLTYEVYYIELLWFLYVLFILFVVHHLIGEMGHKQWFIAFCLVLGFSTLFVPYPNIVNRIFLWSVFFATGRLLAVNEYVKARVNRCQWWIVAGTFIALCFGRIVLNHADIILNDVPLAILKQTIKYMVGFFGVWVIFVLSKVLRGGKLGGLLRLVGDYSYDIYLMHNPYVVAVATIVCSRFLNLPNVISLVIAIVLGIVVPILISKLVIRKNKVLSVVMIGQ